MTVHKPCDPRPPCLLCDATQKMAYGGPHAGQPPSGTKYAAPASNPPKVIPSAPPPINDIFERLDQKLGSSRYYAAFHSLED